MSAIVIGGDLEVRRLGLGAMSLTGPGVWGPPTRPDEARHLLRRAVELGVNLVADALHPYPAGLVVATKAGFTRRGPNRWTPDGRPEHLRAACEASLQRLRLERIDLLYLHTVDPAVPLAESLGALDELRDEGKVRHIGVSNVDVAELEQARAAVPVAAVQNRLSLGERGSEPVRTACERAGIPFVAWAPLAKGFFAGAGGPVARIARRHGATPAQVALAWLLHSPVTIAIPGTSSSRHLEENVGAADLRLTDEEVAELTAHRSRGYRAQQLKRRGRIALGRAKRRLRR